LKDLPESAHRSGLGTKLPHILQHSQEKAEITAIRWKITNLSEPPAGIEPATGDLLITKFRVAVHALDPVFGVCLSKLAISASRVLIGPDFEPNLRKSMAH
jgi:hypothetical protein